MEVGLEPQSSNAGTLILKPCSVSCVALDEELELPEPRFPPCELGLAPALSLALRVADYGAKASAEGCCH